MQNDPQNPLMQGIPKVYYYGQETLFNYLILDCLGPSLEEVFERSNRSFHPKIIAHIAIEMIKRIELIHSCNLIYRDIKPDNFLLPSVNASSSVGRIGGAVNGDDLTTNTDSSPESIETTIPTTPLPLPTPTTSTTTETTEKRPIVYIVDFGMAKHYVDPRTSQHIPFREKKSLSGTARYMSINTHLGNEQSRRDDMESLGNVFMYLLRGSLPWQGLKAKDNREKYERIGQVKQATSPESLAEGKPAQFARYLRYARELDFYQKPDYSMCKALFEEVLMAEDGFQVDWTILSGYSVSGGHKNEQPQTPRRPPLGRQDDHNHYNRHNQHNNRQHNHQQYSSTTNNNNDNFDDLNNHQRTDRRCTWRKLFCLE